MSPDRPPLVALAGNPNTGKTTLFNRLTGANARVGNYPGITVERTVGRLLGAASPIDVLDIPGTYSLVGRSPEEQIAIDAILGRHGNPRPDLVVVVADAQNLERNLYFAAQVIELGRPTLIALNMVDAAKKAGITIDAPALARALGVPVVPVVATRPDTLGALRDAITAALAAPPAPGGWRWTPDATLQADLDALLPVLGDAAPTDATPDLRRAVALWALMSIDESDELTDAPAELRLRVLDRLRDARVAGRDIDGAVIAARYAWIDAHAADWITRAEVPTSWTERVDRVLLNPVAGFFVFLAIMFTVFQALFAWSDPLIGLVEDAFGWLGERVPALLGEGIAADFVKDALIGGVGNVLVFLPQIVLLFIFVAIMEDSGYMARAAFLMDRVMNRIGLHGRAFVPMLSAYACAVPAIMATRTMERRRDRYLTMMVLPLTTCSARLPVYALIIGAIIPAHYVAGVFNTQSLVMGAMYLFGIAMALVAAAVLGRTVLRGPRVPLLMELPPYRMPDPRSVARLVLSRAKVFVHEAGTVILVCTVALWALLYFPRAPEAEAPPAAAQTAIDIPQAPGAPSVTAQEEEMSSRQLRESYAGRLGHAIEPVIAPLGFDWKIGVGIIGAFAAREVFVGTLGVVYSVGEVDEENPALRDAIRAERRPDGRPLYTPLMALSLLVFFALACQCMSTLAAVKRETRSYRWPLFMFAYMTALAWVAAFVVYQGGRLLGFG
ncbi:MAG: ferrous iron transport protein B [Myxococcales bacterium]|nr:ferrous iron transport protein B [Myxococcales bacterium]MCB9541431.1 ferrous iron transport protein B [Myxococcales bacterium]